MESGSLKVFLITMDYLSDVLGIEKIICESQYGSSLCFFVVSTIDMGIFPQFLVLKKK